MKKIIILILLLIPMIILIGCGKSKQEILDKCLVLANQTFPNDLPKKTKLFQGCMAENKYAFNPHSCDQGDQIQLLSDICYVKY